MSVSQAAWTKEQMEKRCVRYSDLRPCYNAFIDTRSPGSEAKENFTIIGPGVSENPEQFVHIAERHGYNIGGARQPPGCVNSQHSHKTAEVFVAHRGKWRFDLGEHGDDAQVVLGEGDVISIPTNIFRGFTNVGNDTGFLWAVLGNDDPGRVTWAPSVFEMARDYGLILLESGRLVDTTRGQAVPDGEKPMRPTSQAEIDAMAKITHLEAERLVWRDDHTEAGTPATIIGANGAFTWPHGFTLERTILKPGDRTAAEHYDGSKVVFVHDGVVRFDWNDDHLTLHKGDTLTVPRGVGHDFYAARDSEIFIVRGA